MEAVQGDNRVNVMQAPRLTAFNGQTATLNVSGQPVVRDQCSGDRSGSNGNADLPADRHEPG